MHQFAHNATFAHANGEVIQKNTEASASDAGAGGGQAEKSIGSDGEVADCPHQMLFALHVDFHRKIFAKWIGTT